MDLNQTASKIPFYFRDGCDNDVASDLHQLPATHPSTIFSILNRDLLKASDCVVLAYQRQTMASRRFKAVKAAAATAAAINTPPPQNTLTAPSTVFGVGGGAGRRRGWTNATQATPRIAIVTYNLLADKFAITGLHDYCPTEHLSWGASRAPRLLQEIKSYAADVLCLQEVERPFFEEVLSPELHRLGYESLFYGRERKASDAVPGPEEGVSLSFLSSRFEKVATTTVKLKDYTHATLFPAGNSAPRAATAGSQKGYKTQKRSAAASFLARVKEREDGAVFALLKDREANKIVFAASVHLFWNPQHPDIKAAQAALLCCAIREFLKSHLTVLSIAKLPILLGGDFNSLPSKTESDAFDVVPEGGVLVSGAYQLLTQGSITAQHQDHPAERRRRRKDDDRSGGINDEAELVAMKLNTGGFTFASAAKTAWGEEPAFTTKTPGFTGTLDYVFYTPENFEVCEILEMPFGEQAGGEEEDKEEEQKKDFNFDSSNLFPFIPDAVWPSDHLAIGAKLRWK